ncbi:MAG: methyltransferase domain-containing protein [Planctomycetota bacterium]|nr:methyltransferase domain-containing protein [Planctomycetota bacterium]
MEPAPAKLRAALEQLPLDRLRVLEPASGPGLYLGHFGPGSRGLDRSAEVVAASAKRLPAGRDLAVEPADLDQAGWALPYRDFEAAWVCDVLCHVREPSAFLAELRDCLRPGAPLVVVEWTLPAAGALVGLRDALARVVPHAKEILNEPEHLRVLRTDELEALVADAGFEPTAQRLHSFHGRPLGRLAARLTRPFWPVRTWYFRRTD